MHTNLSNTAIAVLAMALFSACSTTGGVSTFDSGSSSGNARGTASVVGNARIGDTVELPAGNPTGALKADVIAEYYAASNRRCRQVLPRGGVDEVRLACRNKDGSWEWVRSLSNSSVAKPLPALASIGATGPLVVVGEDQGYQEEPSLGEALGADNAGNVFTVNGGETLWKFSQRTTGSGANWQAIAELNDIDDARSIVNGMILFVPPALVQGH